MEESKAQRTCYTTCPYDTVLKICSTACCEKPRDVMLLQNSFSLLSLISPSFMSGSVVFVWGTTKVNVQRAELQFE